jgi:uncharacterized membrane protein
MYIIIFCSKGITILEGSLHLHKGDIKMKTLGIGLAIIALVVTLYVGFGMVHSAEKASVNVQAHSNWTAYEK